MKQCKNTRKKIIHPTYPELKCFYHPDQKQKCEMCGKPVEDSVASSWIEKKNVYLCQKCCYSLIKIIKEHRRTIDENRKVMEDK